MEGDVLGLEVFDGQDLEEVAIAVQGRGPLSSDRFIHKALGDVVADSSFSRQLGNLVTWLLCNYLRQQIAGDGDYCMQREIIESAILVENLDNSHEHNIVLTV